MWGAFFSCLLAVYLGFNWVPAMLTGAGMSPTVGSAGIAAFNLGGVVGAIAGALAFARLGSKPTMRPRCRAWCMVTLCLFAGVCR